MTKLYSFILTVHELLKKYDLKDSFILIKPLAATLTGIDMLKTGFTLLAAFMVENYYHDKKIEPKNRFYFISFESELFSPYPYAFEERLKILGTKSYKRFLNKICLYVKNEKLSKNDYTLFKQFVVHYKGDSIKNSDKMDECLINFARKGFICECIPDKLNSKYKDEYASFMLMKELINTV